MGAKGSKIKGNRKGGVYEREKAKQLGLGLYGKDCLLRAAGSGSVKKELYYTGDIIPMHVEGENIPFPFHLELKNGYNWELHKLINMPMKSGELRRKKHVVIDFLSQAYKDRVDDKRQPYVVVIMKKSQEGEYAIVPRNYMEDFLVRKEKIARRNCLTSSVLLKYFSNLIEIRCAWDGLQYHFFVMTLIDFMGMSKYMLFNEGEGHYFNTQYKNL